MSRITWRCVQVAVLLHAVPCVSAQRAQAALEAQASSMQCRIETVRPASQGAARASRDRSCGLEAAALSARLARPGVVVVDVRGTAQRQHSRIPNAWVLDVAQVRRQSVLRSVPLVLVGEGVDDALLLEQCGWLRENGFGDVAVLRAGIVSWIKAGQPVLWERMAPTQVQRLTAAQLLQMTLAGDKLFLVTPEAAQFATLLSHATRLTQASAQEVGEVVAKAGASGAVAKADAVVVISERPWSDEQIRQASSASKLPLFVYSGSAAAFDAFVRDQALMWRRGEGNTQVRCPGT